MKAIILAAGYATRLAVLTQDRPKALLDIDGKPLLTRLLEQIMTLPITGVYLVSNHKFMPHFQAWADALPSGIPVVEVLDDGSTSNDNRLGAIGDIQFVLKRGKIDDDVFIAASDNLFEFPLRDFYVDFKKAPRNLLAVTHIEDLELLRRMAVAVLEDDRVVRLVEKPLVPATKWGVFALYMYPRETLPLFTQYLAEGNSPDAPGNFPVWLHTRFPVYAYAFSGRCFDIGTPESYREANEWWHNWELRKASED